MFLNSKCVNLLSLRSTFIVNHSLNLFLPRFFFCDKITIGTLSILLYKFRFYIYFYNVTSATVLIITQEIGNTSGS